MPENGKQGYCSIKYPETEFNKGIQDKARKN